MAEWDPNPLELPHWYHALRFPDPRYEEEFGASTSRWLPFKYGSRATEDDDHYWAVFIPMWVPIMTCLGLSAFCLRKLTRRS
jgi:hypothetical protein